MTKLDAILLIKIYVRDMLECLPQRVGRMEDFETKVFMRRTAVEIAKKIREEDQDPYYTVVQYADKLEGWLCSCHPSKYAMFEAGSYVAEDILTLMEDLDYDD